ncbi:hypothetical protein AAG570_009311 [Ranatra chinensis]|uniref:Uncharacterized protein n=1 Tax=Ranatra chinensis TaxID=642074 RepID=A0ABD0YNQ3_9HEMI
MSRGHHLFSLRGGSKGWVWENRALISGLEWDSRLGPVIVSPVKLGIVGHYPECKLNKKCTSIVCSRRLANPSFTSHNNNTISTTRVPHNRDFNPTVDETGSVLTADGDPIKLPDNLESLPKAEHFPTQRHRWNTNEGGRVAAGPYRLFSTCDKPPSGFNQANEQIPTSKFDNPRQDLRIPQICDNIGIVCLAVSKESVSTTSENVLPTPFGTELAALFKLFINIHYSKCNQLNKIKGTNDVMEEANGTPRLFNLRGGFKGRVQDDRELASGLGW